MGKSLISRVNWPAIFVLLVYPPMLIWGAVVYVREFGFGWFEGVLFALGYYICNISVGLGLHRLWAHNSYKASKALEVVLLFFSAGTLQGPALAWASDHYNHHTYTDADKDPHSPKKYENKFLGFLWSHMGWMIFGEPAYKHLNKFAITKLGKNKLLIWQMQNYWLLAITMNLFVPLLIGFVIGGSVVSAYGAFLFIGLGRALQQQATFCVNSLCHFLGNRKYYNGTAGDIALMAVFLLGENWHNFHHAFPSDYRNGHKWYHLDIHKWLIYGLSKIGLAYDLKFTEENRIQAKMLETQNQLKEDQWQQLVLLKQKANDVLLGLKKNYNDLESASLGLKNNFKTSFEDIQNSLRMVIEQISGVDINDSAKNIVKFLNFNKRKLYKLEKTIMSLYGKLGFSN